MVLWTTRSRIASAHQPGVVAKRDQTAAQVMCANTRLHANEAGRCIGEPVLKLAARELGFEDDGPAPVEANQVENVFANVDADHRNRCVGLR